MGYQNIGSSQVTKWQNATSPSPTVPPLLTGEANFALCTLHFALKRREAIALSFIELIKKNNTNGKDVDADKAFIRSIAISFFAIIVCVVLLSASTFAWFTTTVESENNITSSVYKLDIGVEYSITDGTEVVNPLTDAEGNLSYLLEGGKVYTVTITAEAENVTGKTGYIKMVYGENTLYSEQIDRGETISFTVEYSANTRITIIECWGMSSRPDSERDINNGDALTDTQNP